MSGENVVGIDAAALESEAAAIAIPDEHALPEQAGAAGQGGEAAQLSVDEAAALAASYEAGAYLLLSQASKIVAPNWGVTDAENRELAHVTATALALWFPDQQLPPKYAALLALAGCVYGVAEARRDPDTGRIRPLRAPPAEVRQASQAGADFGG